MVAPAFAWEMEMKGDVEWRYRYWLRTGNNDIFGNMSGTNPANGVQVNLGINHLSLFPLSATTTRITVGNPTIGVVAGQNRYGAEMNAVEYRMTVFPKIKVNPAIDVSASVNLTSLGIISDGLPYMAGVLNPVNSMPNWGYVNSLYTPIQDRPNNINVPNMYMTLQWLKAGIRTPWADFSIGVKDSAFGMGLWKHACNRSSTSFGMTANYGPFKINFSPYFARNQSTWAFPNTRVAAGAGGVTFAQAPQTASRNESFGSAQRHEDRRNYFLAAFGEVSYANGPLWMGIMSDSYREPAASPVDNRAAALNFTNLYNNDDIVRYRIALAMKYFDGRFFFNAEADWFNRWRSGRATAPASLAAPRNQNEDDSAWLYGAELGCVFGPSKVTLNYVRATGDDPSTRNTSEDAAVAEQSINACYISDWGYLMYYMYGTGDGWDGAGYGQPTNFHHLGARVDHAVAANLNIYTLLSYAWRDQPNAYRLGGDYGISARLWTNNDIRTFQAGTFVGQAVPDSCKIIGYEVDLGLQWKLLENLTWTGRQQCRPVLLVASAVSFS
jgi:hypothetical protein